MRYFTGFLSTSPSVRLSFFVIVVVFLLLFPYLSITSLLLQGDTMSQGQIALVIVSVLLPMLGFQTCIYKLLLPCQGQVTFFHCLYCWGSKHAFMNFDALPRSSNVFPLLPLLGFRHVFINC